MTTHLLAQPASNTELPSTYQPPEASTTQFDRESAKVGDTWYRAIDNCIYNTKPFLEYRVIKRTPKGVWLSEYVSVEKATTASFTSKKELDAADAFFVCLNTTKRQAYPTKELALESYYARKSRQLKLLSAQLSSTEDKMARCVTLLEASGIERSRKYGILTTSTSSQLGRLPAIFKAWIKNPEQPITLDDPDVRAYVLNALAHINKVRSPIIGFWQ